MMTPHLGFKGPSCSSSPEGVFASPFPRQHSHTGKLGELEFKLKLCVTSGQFLSVPVPPDEVYRITHHRTLVKIVKGG